VYMRNYEREFGHITVYFILLIHGVSQINFVKSSSLDLSLSRGMRTLTSRHNAIFSDAE